MPVITATHGKKWGNGKNLTQRAQGEEHPIIKIRRASPLFAGYLDALAKETDTSGKARSAFSCAEAQALSKLLGHVGAAVDWQKIRFAIATDDTGHELWTPCANCSAWLTLDSGWGSTRTYKISEEGLNKINGTASTASATQNLDLGNKTIWPELGKA
jgi:hypothetical protein